ncbi:MAG TPA: 7TM diverse intracellular signaling domain-containing protein [Flavilitoribacter sp.]|nr:7TM diverse intracellular signaling domain-containing protein [Flavilitoribacter sp.]
MHKAFIPLLLSIVFPTLSYAGEGVPFDVILKEYTPENHYLGDYFFFTQVLVVGVQLFFFLFIFFQFVQNRRRDYLMYSLYILITFLYSARVNTFCYTFLFANGEQYEAFSHGLRLDICDGTELIFFNLIIGFYMLFLLAFFNLEKNSDPTSRMIHGTAVFTLALAILQILWISLAGLNAVPKLVPENIYKCLFLPINIGLTIRVWKKRNLPGRDFILTGASLLLAGAVVTATTSIFQGEIYGDRLFLQIGTMAEILFFAAALGRKDRVVREAEIMAVFTQKNTGSDLIPKQGDGSSQLPPGDVDHSDDIRDAKHRCLERLKAAIDRDLAHTRENGAKPGFFTVKKYAKEFRMAPVTLYTVVKPLTGKDTKTFILTYLLDQAKEEIKRTETAINLIAEWYGFSSPAHFSTAFKRVYGYPPSGLRER